MLGGQVGFIPLGSRNSPGIRMGDSVMWPNMATDADTMARPLPDGVEIFTQLRSASSPERLAFGFKMPAGASVRPSPMGQHGVEVVSATGRVLSSVGAISAQDADGTPVPVSYRLAGSVLRVHVSHRHGDFHYPILVDPVVTDPNITGAPGSVAAGFWEYFTIGSGGQCFTPFAGNAYLGAGQYIRWLGPGNCRISQYDMGYFFYPAPGDASVTDVNYGYIRQDNRPNTPMCTFTRFVENAASGFIAEPNTTKVPSCFENPVSVSYNVYGGYFPGNFGEWGQYSSCAIGPAPNNYCDYPYFLAYASGLTAYVEDDKAPVIGTGQAPPAGWTNNDSAPISANAVDSGIGTEYATLSAQTGSVSTVLDGRNANAEGLCPYGVRCSPNLPTNATVGQLPEGISTITDQAQDVAGNNTGPQQIGTAKVDRSAPLVTLSGALNDNHDNVPPQNANLHVSATDGSNDGNPADERSGVASLVVQVDGTQVAAQNQTCDNSCPLALDYTFDQTKYSAGAHTITVIATDLAGNISTPQNFTVFTDQDVPDVTESGTLWDANGAHISNPSYTLNIDATDGSSDLPDSGVASVAVNVDGQQQLSASQPCGQGSCAMSQTFTFQTAQYGAGDHTIDIYVTDQVGHQTHDQETVTVVQTPTQAPQSGNAGSSSERTFQGANSNDQAGSSVVDIGDINGDGIDDYAIGAPGATSQTVRSQSGKIYIVYGSASGGLTNLGSLGSGGFEIDGATGDRAGMVLSTGNIAGDGTDLIIGAPGSAVNGFQGKVYVVFNSALSSGNVDLSNLGSNGFVVNGPAASALNPSLCAGSPKTFGAILATPGTGTLSAHVDVNGDGLDDIAIGSPTDSNNNRTCSGSTYVIYGKSDPGAINAGSLTAPQGFRIDGAQANDQSGTSAATVGDTNGSGNAAVAIGAPASSLSPRTSAGTGYVVYGSPTPMNVDLANLGTQGYPVYGANNSGLGSSVTSMNLDGSGEQAIVFGGNGAYVILGHETSDPIDFASPDPETAYAIAPPPGVGYNAANVTSAGDNQALGLPGLLVAFPGANGQTGSVFTLNNQDGADPTSSLAQDLGNLPGQFGALLTGENTGDQAGVSTAAVDNDPAGNPAMLIGAPAAQNSAGRAYLEPARAPGQPGQPTAQTSSASGSGSALKNRCYFKTSPAYPFDGASDFPKCRYTAVKNVDQTPKGAANGYADQSKGYEHTRPVGPNVRRKIMGGILGNKKPVTLYDSALNIIGKLQVTSSAGNRNSLTLFDASGTKLVTSRGTAIQVESTPCLTDPQKNNPGGYALISVQGSESPSNPIPGLRAIVSRNAIPPNSINPHGDKQRHSTVKVTNDQIISSAWNSCSKPSIYRRLTYNLHPYQYPKYRSSDAYQGGNVAKISPTRGDQYWNYQFPRDPISGFPTLAIVTSSTTGVADGGVARSVFEDDGNGPYGANGALSTHLADKIRYTDHNVPCKSPAVTQWLFEAVDRHTYSWYPIRNPDGFIRTKSPPC